METIGIVCEADHPVFGPAAERLAARGFGIEFFQPGEPLSHAAIDGLAALVNTVVTRCSFAALRYADRTGIETWNGFVPTTALSCRLVALNALEELGCHVPSLQRATGEENTVTKRRVRWDDEVDIDGEFAYDDVRSEPVTYRYYAVDDGVETHVHALAIRSELTDPGSLVDDADVNVELATRVRELLDRFDARAVAVDFVRAGDSFFVVDADPTPQFFDAEIERHIADSMASLTTIGA